MDFTMFITASGHKIGVRRDLVFAVEQDPDSPTHSILHFRQATSEPTPPVRIVEEFFVALSRLNTIAE